MNDESLTTSSPSYLITCVVQRGKGDNVVKGAVDAGAGGATVFFSRGTGTRERLGLLGLAIVPEKEVVLIIAKADEKDRIFDAVCKAGKLDIPGMGIAYITPVVRMAGGGGTV